MQWVSQSTLDATLVITSLGKQRVRRNVPSPVDQIQPGMEANQDVMVS